LATRRLVVSVLASITIILTASSASQAANSNCIGFCANAKTFLSASHVKRVIAQAVTEARARKADVTVAVVDRVGNVLGVYQTRGAKGKNITIRSGRFFKIQPSFGQGGLESGAVPATFAAIAKAITGAYLSSEGNAFSTRTANQIVQEYFNPGEIGQPSGPLFGVQFSQLPCGDLVQREMGLSGPTRAIGPRRSPLGLSADPGGLPLYLNGTPVGGIGVMVGNVYSVDLEILDQDKDIDELVALAGTVGFAAPDNRRADKITAGGLLLRFTDVDFGDLKSKPRTAAAFDAINKPSVGGLVSADGFYNKASGIRRGVAFGQPASGIERADKVDPKLFSGLDAFVLTNGASNNRYPPTGASNSGQRLSKREVLTVLRKGLKVANSARAQIRQPPGSQARVTVSVVDLNGMILGIARTRDAPVFGIDVSLQKARTAAFFSSRNAASSLKAKFGAYVREAQNFVEPPHQGKLFADGTAFTARAIGNIARPYFPDGNSFDPVGGPLSKPARTDGVFKRDVNEWSPFNVGLQLDLVAGDVVSVLKGANPKDCNTLNGPSIKLGRLANGIQIFPGSVPIYKRGKLVGAVGVSGDGVDQDDMVAFLGVHEAGRALRGSITNAPAKIRADNVRVEQGGDKVSLRYVQCPVAPFINSDIQNPCNGR
jgi:uncharacterized protein GlcG (DUF336 family)